MARGGAGDRTNLEGSGPVAGDQSRTRGKVVTENQSFSSGLSSVLTCARGAVSTATSLSVLLSDIDSGCHPVTVCQQFCRLKGGQGAGEVCQQFVIDSCTRLVHGKRDVPGGGLQLLQLGQEGDAGGAPGREKLDQNIWVFCQDPEKDRM